MGRRDYKTITITEETYQVIKKLKKNTALQP